MSLMLSSFLSILLSDTSTKYSNSSTSIPNELIQSFYSSHYHSARCPKTHCSREEDIGQHRVIEPLEDASEDIERPESSQEIQATGLSLFH